VKAARTDRKKVAEKPKAGLRRDRAPFNEELIDEWLKQGRKPEDVQGLLKQITKAVLERAMQAELTDQFGYEKHDPAGYNSGNSRNGYTRKTLKGDFGELEVETPRDRNGEYAPQIIQKNQTRWTGFRRQDPVHVRARHDDARHPVASGGDVSGGSEPQPDQRGDRRRLRAGTAMAEPAA
jgi:hypothetical protein